MGKINNMAWMNRFHTPLKLLRRPATWRLKETRLPRIAFFSDDSSSTGEGETPKSKEINLEIPKSVEVADPTTPKILEKLYWQIDVQLTAHQPAVLRSYSWFMSKAAKELGIQVGEIYNEPFPHKVRKTLLKSKHVHKKHRVQYEIQTYFHFISVRQLTGSTADTYLEYTQRFLPEGVGMKVTRHELTEFPENVAKRIDEDVTKHLDDFKKRDKSDVTCYICKNLGHYSKECPERVSKRSLES